MSNCDLGRILVCLAVALAAVVSRPALGQPDEPDPVWLGVDYDDSELIGHDWSYNNYICQEIARCAKDTPVANPQGNIKGCVPKTTTPPTCIGSCTMCAGGETAGYNCRRTNVPTDSCAGSGGAMECGQPQTSTCVFALPNAGLNGCGCTIPPTYPPTGSCVFAMCQL
jgi:hypothetical protein